MGIDANGARFLVHAHAMGVDFARTASIGRQSLYVAPDALRAIFADHGLDLDAAEAVGICEGSEGFSDGLLRRLGALDPHSIDYSPYERPTHTHDMNRPIPDALRERYSVVLDGGSLEHVFDFPTAIRNCMEMVEIGGHYLAITPANNFFGHGFYQFSPELYFTVLSPENGFTMVRMIAFEERKDPVWYEVANPREVGGRVTLANAWPVYLLVIARRIARLPIFSATPQQSDYQVIWGEREAADAAQAAGHAPLHVLPLPLRLAKRVLPSGLRLWLRGLQRRLDWRKPPVFDPRFFRRMA